jgi:hypothetical protein
VSEGLLPPKDPMTFPTKDEIRELLQSSDYAKGHLMAALDKLTEGERRTLCRAIHSWYQEADLPLSPLMPKPLVSDDEMHDLALPLPHDSAGARVIRELQQWRARHGEF